MRFESFGALRARLTAGNSRFRDHLMMSIPLSSLRFLRLKIVEDAALFTPTGRAVDINDRAFAPFRAAD
jgi:hypothetical protein